MVLPFDFNPRIAASVAFCSAAGANLIYFALKMALGEEVPKVEVKDGVMMLRYFKELYVGAVLKCKYGSYSAVIFDLDNVLYDEKKLCFRGLSQPLLFFFLNALGFPRMRFIRS